MGCPHARAPLFCAWGIQGKLIAGLPSRRSPRCARSRESSGRRWKPSCAVRWSFPAIDGELSIAQTRWLRAMDALLPRDIAVQEVFQAHSDFSARFDALARTYTYRIADRPNRPVLTRDHVWWQRMPLDEEAMGIAAQHLVGEHDFKSFCKMASAVGKPTCRNVMSVGFERTEELGEEVLAFTITGNAFLHSMVRTIVGTLVEVGLHRREPSWVSEVLAACDRRAAGPTAPACGLTFVDVAYPPGILTPLA